jgi:hypothetical protein
MVELDFSGDFLKLENTKDGDIAVILDECKEEYNETLKKNIKNMSVEVNGSKKTYSPNNAAGLALVQAFGKDSKDWIGQKFEIMHVQGKLAIRPIKKTA